MKLGFVLFDYFPFGGLERDCFRIASLCAEAGHDITFYTRTWQGERSENMKVELFGRHGVTIPARNRRFVAQLADALPRHALEGVIGFNRLPGLDVYYGADLCYAAALEPKTFWNRWLPRYRQYVEFERAAFQRGAHTGVPQITPRDIPAYNKVYGTENRFHVLPPNARRHVFACAPEAVAASVDRVNHDYATGDVDPHSFPDYASEPRSVTTIIFMNGPPGTPNTVVRAGAFRQAGGFDHQWAFREDCDLLLRVSLLGRWLYVPGEPVITRNHLEVVTGSGEPPLSRKYADRAFRRVQMLHRFIFECGGKSVVPENIWRARLAALWFKAGRKLAAMDRPADARLCFQRTIELKPRHLLARLRLLTSR